MNNFENCGYYIDDECTICGMGTDGEDTFCKYCKDNPNCYYKQLAELKAENDRLKEANQSLSMLGTDLASVNETVRKAFFRADKNKDMWREKAEKLQKTLQEIKKYIAKICKEECGYVQKKRCPDCDCRYGAILDLITKAEKE